jgi:serine/threonine protein kinase/Tfp pilus assembly protein PilF
MNNYRRTQELFHAVLEIEPEQRAAYLDAACNGDGSLRVEVESMVACFGPAIGFIEAPAFELAADLLAHEERASIEGQRIGSYRVVREIGRGGMGTVFLAARDDDQYDQQVALKLIKRGMDTDFIVQRFRNERQILARLDHPNIARLLDGGVTDEGLPFFVMEYIDGKPVTEYCELKELSIPDRLKLFLGVCAAVSYAHQNLVIHRDLKPGNILITSDGAPKLLDFGIAKLLNPELSAQTIEHTATVLRLMTPDYASPEQIKGDAITTASDVYSLGVLLYELLTGNKPYRLKNRSPEAFEQLICQQEPDKPSESVSGSEPPAIAGGPISSGGLLSRWFGPPATAGGSALRGDLDNIVLMAMRKEPERRYSSVEQFAEDIRRHLEGLPVIARKDTFSYRASKFIRRNKLGVAAAAAIFLTLIAGIAATGWQAKVAARQAKVAAEQRDTARIETAKAERINKFMQDMLASANANWYASGHGGKGGDTRVIDVLNQAAQRLETELNDQPEVKAELYRTIGTTYLGIGRQDLAVPQFRASLKIYRELYGERHLKVAEALYFLASSLVGVEGRDVAEPLFREAVELQRELPGGDNNYLPHMVLEYGNLMVAKGDSVKAESLILEAIDLFRKHYGDSHLTVGAAYASLATFYEHQGDLQKSEASYRKAVEIYDRSPDSSAVFKMDAFINLSGLLIEEKRYDDAERLADQAMALYRAIPDRFESSLSRLLVQSSSIAFRKQDHVKALKEAGEAVVVARRARTGIGLQTELAISLENLGFILTNTGKPAQAEPRLRESLAIWKGTTAKGDPAIANATSVLGECLTKQRRYREAEALLIESDKDFSSNAVEQNPRRVESRQRLVKLYEAWGKPDLAARYR